MGHVGSAIASRLGEKKWKLSWVTSIKNYKYNIQNDFLIIRMVKNALNNYEKDISLQLKMNKEDSKEKSREKGIIKNRFVSRSLTQSNTKIACIKVKTNVIDSLVCSLKTKQNKIQLSEKRASISMKRNIIDSLICSLKTKQSNKIQLSEKTALNFTTNCKRFSDNFLGMHTRNVTPSLVVNYICHKLGQYFQINQIIAQVIQYFHINQIIAPVIRYFHINQIIAPVIRHLKRLRSLRVFGRLTRKERAAVIIRKFRRVTLAKKSADIEHASQSKALRFGMSGISAWFMLKDEGAKPMAYNFSMTITLRLVILQNNSKIKKNIRKTPLKIEKRFMFRGGRLCGHANTIYTATRRFHSSVIIYHYPDKCKPIGNQTSITKENFTVPTPIGCKKEHGLHPKVVIDDKNYFVCMTHKLPELSKLPPGTKILFFEYLGRDLNGELQYILATNLTYDIAFLTFGGPAKHLNDHFFGENNPNREVNLKRCRDAHDAVENFFKTGIILESMQNYNLLVKTSEEKVKDLTEEMPTRSMQEIAYELKARMHAEKEAAKTNLFSEQNDKKINEE